MDFWWGQVLWRADHILLSSHPPVMIFVRCVCVRLFFLFGWMNLYLIMIMIMIQFVTVVILSRIFNRVPLRSIKTFVIVPSDISTMIFASSFDGLTFTKTRWGSAATYLQFSRFFSLFLFLLLLLFFSLLVLFQSVLKFFVDRVFFSPLYLPEEGVNARASRIVVQLWCNKIVIAIGAMRGDDRALIALAKPFLY